VDALDVRSNILADKVERQPHGHCEALKTMSAIALVLVGGLGPRVDRWGVDLLGVSIDDGSGSSIRFTLGSAKTDYTFLDRLKSIFEAEVIGVRPLP
jgi:hypothetical protein